MIFRKGSNTSNIIFVRDLVTDMQIGVFDSEKGRTQRVRVNLEVEPALWPDEKRDDITETVSYDDLVKIVFRHTGGGHVHLVETLAERIASDALSESPIRWIRVRIEKLDIYPYAVPGVEIFRAK